MAQIGICSIEHIYRWGARLLACWSGSLPDYQKHDLFFGKLPKIAGWQACSQNCEDVAFLVIRG
jgi:hypothetical protein